MLNALATTKKGMPIPVALVIATQMCHALGYAHAFRDSSGARRQIIHSDVSPSNVMVCRDGSVKLLDFGVAKVIDACDYDTSQTVQGKFPYMSPEQVNRLPVDRRADVFAAGIVTHEMLAGRRLFAGATELETLRRVDACEVAPPSVLTVNWLARPVPLHATSTGKAWLAWLPEPEARGALGTGLEAFTDATVTDVARLFDDFAQIRRQGYAVSAGELEPALFGVSAPVLSRTGSPEPQAVFSIWGPAAPVPQSRLKALGAVAIDAAAAVATSLRD